MVRLVKIGKCGNCGKEFVRPPSCTHAACNCENPPVEVPLEMALILPPRYMKKIEKVSELSDVPVEKLMDALLKEISKAVMKGLKAQ